MGKTQKGAEEGVPLQNLPDGTKLDFLAKRKSFPSTVMSLFQPLERMFHLLECTFHRLERMFHQLEHNFLQGRKYFYYTILQQFKHYASETLPIKEFKKLFKFLKKVFI